MENKICQNCKQAFIIDPEDFAFYERIKVPPPTFCWQCRNQQRMGARSNRTFYKDTCDLCKKDMISLYAPDAPYTVYCNECWISDAWDPMKYGRDYDFSKPFFAQYYELARVVPRQATRVRNSPGSRYCDGTTNCKNCYMVTGGYGSEDCIYGGPVFSKHSVDSYLVLNADRAYDNFSSSNIYGTKFVYYSEECMDSSFLFDCKGCTNCFGCVNLRNKQYCIFNQQYSKAEYREQMKYWDTGSFVRLQEAREKFMALKMQTPHRYAIVTNGIDVTGNDIQNSKNCTYCFVAKNGVENCKYISGGGLLLKDSHDVTSGGDKSQVLYNCAGTVSSDHMICVNGANTAHDVAYSEQAINCSDMFGCAFLKHKQFCILNKQYTEQEYRSLREKIVQQMYDMPYRDRKDRSYTYGDYFPIEMSPFAYNESWAFDQYALTKEKTQAAGYNWRDRVSSHHVPDIRSGELVDHIRDVDASITTRVIECAHRESCNEICTGAFKVIPEELQFYQQNNVALPRLCPNCRHFQRLSFQNPLKLWHRKCANCTNEFETTYAPDRKEIIYCQECYNREFL